MADTRTDAEILSKKESFLIPFYPTETYLELLTDEQAGRLFKMYFNYELFGEIPELGELKLEFLTFKKYADERRAEYIKTSRKNSENARARWDKTKSD